MSQIVRKGRPAVGDKTFRLNVTVDDEIKNALNQLGVILSDKEDKTNVSAQEVIRRFLVRDLKQGKNLEEIANSLVENDQPARDRMAAA